jgi:hypothetical protein
MWVKLLVLREFDCVFEVVDGWCSLSQSWHLSFARGDDDWLYRLLRGRGRISPSSALFRYFTLNELLMKLQVWKRKENVSRDDLGSSGLFFRRQSIAGQSLCYLYPDSLNNRITITSKGAVKVFSSGNLPANIKSLSLLGTPNRAMKQSFWQLSPWCLDSAFISSRMFAFLSMLYKSCKIKTIYLAAFAIGQDGMGIETFTFEPA